MTVANSVIWDNVFNDIFVDVTSPLTVTYSDVEGGWPGTGNIDLDPLFTNAASGDYTLQGGSPAIDTGDPAPGFNDVDGSRNDMGAFSTSPVLVTFQLVDQHGVELPASSIAGIGGPPTSLRTGSSALIPLANTLPISATPRSARPGHTLAAPSTSRSNLLTSQSQESAASSGEIGTSSRPLF